MEIKLNCENPIFKCICGKPLIPDKKALNFKTKKWDGHTYKYNCNCLKNKKVRISIG